MANATFPISLWHLVLQTLADYGIRKDVACLQDEESYYTRTFYPRKLKEMKETGLAPAPSPSGFWMKATIKVGVWLMKVAIIALNVALYGAALAAIIFVLYYSGLLVVFCVHYVIDAVKKLRA